MELNKIEQLVVETTSKEAEERCCVELTELQLLLVGGGIGDTILH